MGGSSKSSTSSTTNQYETTGTLADYSQGDGNRVNASAVGSGNTVNVLDGGAIRDSLSFADKQAERTQISMAASIAATHELAARQSQNDADTVKKIIALTDTVTTGGAMTTTKWVLGAIIIAVLAWAAVQVAGDGKRKG